MHSNESLNFCVSYCYYFIFFFFYFIFLFFYFQFYYSYIVLLEHIILLFIHCIISKFFLYSYKKVRMVSLAGTQLDYCVYQCFNPSMSALDILTILNEVLIATATFFFNVIAIIGDGAQCNRQFQKRYFT